MCVCMQMLRYTCAYTPSRVSIFTDLSVQNFDVSQLLCFSWLVPVHQDETIWLADHSPLSQAVCFIKWCWLLSCSTTQCTSRSTFVHFFMHLTVTLVWKLCRSPITVCWSLVVHQVECLVLGVVFKWMSEWKWCAKKIVFLQNKKEAFKFSWEIDVMNVVLQRKTDKVRLFFDQ